MIDLTEKAYRYFTLSYGSVPGKEFKVFSFAYDYSSGFNFACVPRNYFTTSQQTNPMGYPWRNFIHEISHTWWGNLVSSLSHENYWMFEGFAKYSEIDPPWAGRKARTGSPCTSRMSGTTSTGPFSNQLRRKAGSMSTPVMMAWTKTEQRPPVTTRRLRFHIRGIARSYAARKLSKPDVALSHTPEYRPLRTDLGLHQRLPEPFPQRQRRFSLTIEPFALKVVALEREHQPHGLALRIARDVRAARFGQAR